MKMIWAIIICAALFFIVTAMLPVITYTSYTGLFPEPLWTVPPDFFDTPSGPRSETLLEFYNFTVYFCLFLTVLLTVFSRKNLFFSIAAFIASLLNAFIYSISVWVENLWTRIMSGSSYGEYSFTSYGIAAVILAIILSVLCFANIILSYRYRRSLKIRANENNINETGSGDEDENESGDETEFDLPF